MRSPCLSVTRGPGTRLCLPALHPQHAGCHPRAHHPLIPKGRLLLQAARTEEELGLVGGGGGAPRSQKPEAVPENAVSVYVSLARMGSRGAVAARGSGIVSISAGCGATLDRARVLMHGRGQWTLQRQPAASATLFFTAQLRLHPR